MNANELAYELEIRSVEGSQAREAATMLRQQQADLKIADDAHDILTRTINEQQAEIETLKLQLHTTLTNRNLRTYDGKTEINNEPLAWALRKAQEK